MGSYSKVVSTHGVKIKKPRYVPTMMSYYCYIETMAFGEIKISYKTFKGSPHDQTNLVAGNCFPDEETAKKAVAKILAVFDEVHDAGYKAEKRKQRKIDRANAQANMIANYQPED